MSLDALALKEQIILRIEKADDSFLRILDAMTAAYENEQNSENEIVGYRIDGSPVIADDAIEEYGRRVEAMKSGQKTSIEDFRKETEKW